MFFSILLFAHFQAAIIPILLGIRSIKKFKHIHKNELIPLGFIFLGLASISEMIDHTQTSWIYVDHSSLFKRRGWDSNPRCPCRHASFQD